MEKKNTLPLITKKEEIFKNITTINKYLDNPNSIEYNYARGLIRRGKCYIAFSYKGEYRFCPSRFIGYVNNTMEAHEYMGKKRKETGKTTRDGKETNPAISAILGDIILVGDTKWKDLEASFLIFCKKLGVKPYKNERKYWKFDGS